MTENDKNAKMLERVRALLAKAESTTFPEEADAFRAKADEIMTAYSISAWQVQMAQEGLQRTIQPEVRWFDFSWWNAILQVLLVGVCRVVWLGARKLLPLPVLDDGRAQSAGAKAGSQVALQNNQAFIDGNLEVAMCRTAEQMEALFIRAREQQQ